MTTTVKWSAFTDGNEIQVGDEVVGLRSGGNYRFEFPGTGIKDGNGNYLISYATNGAGATNYMTIENNVASNKPAISTAGTDESVGLTISTKGSGVVSIPTIVSDITQLNVDNIRLDGNTISSADTNGDILITPNGTGKVGIGVASPGAKLDVDGTLFADSISFNTGTATINGFNDDDTMASASATTVASDESIKAYVDASSASRDYRFISSATASSSASISFTSLGSAFSKYLVVMTNVAPATDSATLAIRTSTDNGSSYDSGVSDYQYVYSRIAGTTAQVVDAAASEIILLTPQGNASNETLSGNLNIFNPSSTSYTQVHYDGTMINDTGEMRLVSASGQRNSAADVDAIQIFFTSGNIASGVFSLYGITAT